MAATMKNEYTSLYRHLMLEEYQKEGMSRKEAISSYKEHANECGLQSMSGPEIFDMTVDRLAHTKVAWADVRDSYMLDTRNADMAQKVVDAVEAQVRENAYNAALQGQWSTDNDRYLSDDERLAVADKEMREAEERADARAEEREAAAKAEIPYTIYTNKKGTPYVNAEFEGKNVQFKQTYGDHTFDHDEIQTLLRGEKVSMMSRSGKDLELALGEGTYMGRPYFGPQVTNPEAIKSKRALSDVPSVGAAEQEAELG